MESGSAFGLSHSVRHIQTHMSHVFLTGSRAYKFRKSVDLGFCSFLTLAQRQDDVARELRLNRRLAPQVYLGICTFDGRQFGPLITNIPSSWPETELALVMVELDPQTNAKFLLEAGTLQGDHLAHAAKQLAEFHRQNRLNSRDSRTKNWEMAHYQPALDNPIALKDYLKDRRGDADELTNRIQAFQMDHPNWFTNRLQHGRAVDGHGDLHLEHLWFPQPAHPIWIDCLEFRDDFRLMDTVYDIGFLAMDLVYRGRPDFADHFLQCYSLASLDYDSFKGLRLAMSYRAAVRAKVAAMACADPEIERHQREAALESAHRHLDLALHVLRPVQTAPIIATCGAVGTGKSTLAKAIAKELGGIRIASDVLRKRLAGVEPHHHLASQFYDWESTVNVYKRMKDYASSVAQAGRIAILDATYASEKLRAFLPPEAILVWLEADRDELQKRLTYRATDTSTESDAGPELLEQSLAYFEPPTQWPNTIRIDTGHSDWLEQAIDALRQHIT
ncbi:MAG: AAA family ATPase [Acidobacteria bacterium]|nr:AAA family ATPase [Acidobacteriota bacterium]